MIVNPSHRGSVNRKVGQLAERARAMDKGKGIILIVLFLVALAYAACLATAEAECMTDLECEQMYGRE